MDERFTQYQLVKSKDGLTVPYINDVYLHSMYNPVKEAEGFAQLHKGALEKKCNIIILGLGFGYHVEEAAKVLAKNHDSYKIIVIEPNEKLYRDFTEQQNFTDASILPIFTTNEEALFERRDFVELLLTRPAILKHDTSFMLNKDFFTRFLMFKADTYLSSLSRSSKYLEQFIEMGSDRDLETYSEELLNKKKLARKDFLFLAFNELNYQLQDGQ